MESWSRRSALVSMAMAPIAAIAPGPWMAAGVANSLRLPPAPMRLVRRLERELADGNRIVVEREWLIAFTAQAAEVVISGRQLRVEVTAPPRISAIAEIERRRSTDGKFPILLDADGLISASGNATNPQDLADAVRTAQEIIARQAASPLEAARGNLFLAQLQQAGSAIFDSLPRDLFFPRKPAWREVRPVSLPDGSTGEFEVDYVAVPAPGAAWLDHAKRKVTTRLAGTERRSSEYWQMLAA